MNSIGMVTLLLIGERCSNTSNYYYIESRAINIRFTQNDTLVSIIPDSTDIVYNKPISPCNSRTFNYSVVIGWPTMISNVALRLETATFLDSLPSTGDSIDMARNYSIDSNCQDLQVYYYGIGISKHTLDSTPKVIIKSIDYDKTIEITSNPPPQSTIGGDMVDKHAIEYQFIWGINRLTATVYWIKYLKIEKGSGIPALAD
jgi:hypothetical protein